MPVMKMHICFWKIFGIVGLALLMGIRGEAVSATQIDRIVAIIGGEVLTQSELDLWTAYRKAAAPQTQDASHGDVVALIDQRLILQEAKRRNVYPNDAELELALHEMQRQNQFLDRETFKNVVTSGQIEMWENYREAMRTQIAFMRLSGDMGEETIIASNEIQDYYDRYPQAFMEPSAIALEQLLFPKQPPVAVEAGRPRESEPPASVFESIRLAETGQPFSVLAERHQATSEHLGLFKEGELAAPIASVVANLRVDEVSQPLETDAGWHLFRLTEQRLPRRKTLQESEAAIRAILLEHQRRVVQQAWLADLRRVSYIRRIDSGVAISKEQGGQNGH